MQYIKSYPASILILMVILYLSFFKPPQTELQSIPYFDKLVHVCMYGGLTTILWIEHIRRHKAIKWKHLIAGGCVAPVLMSGLIEILQGTCTDTRSSDWLDFLANCTGVAMASLFVYYIAYPFLHKKYQKETPGASQHPES